MENQNQFGKLMWKIKTNLDTQMLENPKLENQRGKLKVGKLMWKIKTNLENHFGFSIFHIFVNNTDFDYISDFGLKNEKIKSWEINQTKDLKIRKIKIYVCLVCSI